MDNNWDKYIIEGTNVLKNKLGITDKETLEQKEKELVLPHLAFLHLNPILTVPSAEGLKDIHQFLFSDLYSWAGQYRTCTLRKNTYNFTDPSLIEEELKSVIERYSNEIDRVQTKDEYAFVLAPFYYDLIRVHPFREGNGRSIREFLREVVILKNKTLPFEVELDYTKVDKENMLKGTAYRYFFPSMLELEFSKGLVPLEKEKKNTK